MKKTLPSLMKRSRVWRCPNAVGVSDGSVVEARGASSASLVTHP